MSWLKRQILAPKKNFILTSVISVLISIIISLILLLDKYSNISNAGAIILVIFQYAVYQTFWFILEIKFKLETWDKNKIESDQIISNFGEWDFLRDRFSTTFINDLNLDFKLKKNKDQIKEPHFYLSKVKFTEFLQEFFIVDPINMEVRDVPSTYFVEKIWRKLVTDSSFYYSVQRLTEDQIRFYTENDECLRSELGVLESYVDSSGTTDEDVKFKKLFVLEDKDFPSENTKIQDGYSNSHQHKLFNYLSLWKEIFPNTNDNQFQIKVINRKNAQSHAKDDIGIFGNKVFGIQRPRLDSEKKIMDERLKIDFYFNRADVDNKLKEFKQVFDRKNGSCRKFHEII